MMESKRMTWGDFKKFVDDELKKQNYGDNTVIDYIDIVDPQFFKEKSDKPRYGEIDIYMERDGLAIY